MERVVWHYLTGGQVDTNREIIFSILFPIPELFELSSFYQQKKKKKKKDINRCKLNRRKPDKLFNISSYNSVRLIIKASCYHLSSNS